MSYKGKIVEVHRHFSMLAMAQNDPEVQAWYGEAFRAIGPYYYNKAPGTGLTFEEQNILLPEILGIEATDKDFRKAVTNFYHEFLTRVPKAGLKLQISLQNDAMELSANNKPINIKDYLAYRHLTKHPEVAKDLATAERTFICKFYLHDPEGVTQEALKVNELEDKATVIYMKYKDDPIKTDQILTMLGVNIRGMKAEQKVLKLKEFAKKDEKSNEMEQKAELSRFIDVAEDKDLEYKYLIQEMIGAQFLRRVGTAIAYDESGETIGQNMQEAVMYFKNPKNSRELNILKSNYLTKMKKGAEYLPGEKKSEVAVEKESAKAE